MAKRSELIQHIESFVDSTRSSSHQAASVDAATALLKNDAVTIQELVREMDMYLTTTDDILRARGILFLGEVLVLLASKPLDTATIHSLIGFFSDRLSDWRALRGALVGCVALVTRKSEVGRVSGNDSRALAQSYLQNLDVQSLGQHDRKLCFELLVCLMDCYPEEIAALGDHLVYGVCQAIEGEKDPQCLMLTFRIVEVLAGLFPDPAGPVANVSEEIFDILGCYFPIHYTHPKSEDVLVSREKLSMALKLAFSSTPFFEPFAIPLLLEKLDSSLPLAKVDSLKYLSYCANTFGPRRIGKHAEAIWIPLKSAIQCSLEDHVSPSAFDLTASKGFRENEIMSEAFNLLQIVVSQPDNVFLDVILQDTEIKGIVNSIGDFGSYDNIPLQSKHKLLVVGCVLSILAKASSASCNRVFETIFLPVLDALGIPRNGSIRNSLSINVSYDRLNFGALYLSVQIIAASQDLAMRSKATVNLEDSTWFRMVNSLSSSLIKVLSSTITGAEEKYLDPATLLGVTGLEVLATFPGDSFPISKSIFENILMILVSAITMDFSVTSLWSAALKSLVYIGSFIDSHPYEEKSSCYSEIVVRRILSFLTRTDHNMPLSLVLETVSSIISTGHASTVIIAQVMEETIAAKLSEVLVSGDDKLCGNLVQLLRCYSSKLLPRMHKLGDFEEEVFHFAVDICKQIEKCAMVDFSIKTDDLLSVTMAALKQAVANCSEENQRMIVDKAFMVFSSGESFMQMQSIPLQLEAQLVGGTLASRDEWMLSFFASIIIAVHPKTSIPDVKAVVLTLTRAVLKGHVPSAQALGSMVNKMSLKGTEVADVSCFYLEDVLDIIFKVRLWRSLDNVLLRNHGNDESGENSWMCQNDKEVVLQAHWIIGLAWIGKGLLMRGHEKVKDITMILLQCLWSNSEVRDSPLQPGLTDERNVANMHRLMRSAADAFRILISDSEDCLDRRFHATVRPLYKQWLFSTLTPILLTSLMKCQSSVARSMLYRAFGHIISNAPLLAVLGDMKKLVRVLLDAFPVLSEDILNRDMVYNLLLVLSAFLTDKSGQDVVEENAHFIINRLTQLVYYPHKMLVRETALQCLIAMTGVAHARIYPMRTQVLQAVSKVLNDQKRTVRQEAVRCWHAWRSIA